MSFVANSEASLPLPAFDSSGDLPPRIRPATLRELCKRFGEQNRTREIVFGRLRGIVEIVEEDDDSKR